VVRSGQVQDYPWGSAIASLLVPGVGTIFAIGMGAAALLGLGGAAAGAILGEASEQAADIGVPKDDTFLYRELLKRGRSLVIANVDDPDLLRQRRSLSTRALKTLMKPVG